MSSIYSFTWCMEREKPTFADQTLKRSGLTKLFRARSILQPDSKLVGRTGADEKMDIPDKETKSTTYRIRVKNHLDSHWEHWFDGMRISHTDNGQTILSGVVVDQGALHGVLEKIRNLNLTLISVQKVDTDEENSST